MLNNEEIKIIFKNENALVFNWGLQIYEKT